jgi:parallel beta-helix repeat protein
VKRSLHASAAALTLLAIVLASSAAPTASAETTCSRFASTSGSNSNPGTAAAPYRTVQFLVSRLQAGETGCLRTGEFSEHVAIGRGGNPGNPIVLTSAPGERATLLGTLSVGDGANDVVVAGLVLNGRNSNRASPIVNGDRVTLRDNEITNEHTAICVLLGPGFESAPERALDPVVERNRIHDCGRLPGTGHDHGIYVEGTTNARILDNVIYDNADYGIHLYPDGDGSTIAHNVIDGNGGGLIFAGERAGGEYSNGYSSDRNVVEHNVITNNSQRNNIESWWGGPVGEGNIARGNCLWNGRPANIDDSAGGFTHPDNATVDPRYTNRAAKDFTLAPGSPCTGHGPRTSPSPSPPSSPQPTPNGPPTSPSAPLAALAISPPSVRVTPKRTAVLRLSTRGAARGSVRGTLALRLRGKRTTVSAARFVLQPGRTRRVTLRLSRHAMKRLRGVRRLRTTATALGRDGLGARRRGSRTVTLLAPRRPSGSARSRRQ